MRLLCKLTAVTKQCATCGKEFWAHRTSNRYCSQTCAHVPRKLEYVLSCRICGSEMIAKIGNHQTETVCSRDVQPSIWTGFIEAAFAQAALRRPRVTMGRLVNERNPRWVSA